MNVVTLYTQDGCMKCKQLKMLLEKSNIEYKEETSVDKMIELGFTKTPVLYADGKYMYSNDAEKWIMDYRKGDTNEKQ